VSKEKRKRYWIDTAIQGAIVRRLIGYWVTFVVMAFLTLCLWQFLTGMDVHQAPASAFGAIMCNNLPLLYIALLMLPIVVVDSIHLCHRVIGPVLKIGRTLEAINNGVITSQVELRHDDFWQDLANQVNRLPKQQEHSPSRSS